MIIWAFIVAAAVLLLIGGIQDLRTHLRKAALSKKLGKADENTRVFLSADGNCAVAVGEDFISVVRTEDRAPRRFSPAELQSVRVVENGVTILESGGPGWEFCEPSGKAARRKVRDLCVVIRTSGQEERSAYYFSLLNVPKETRKSAFYRARLGEAKALVDALCAVVDGAAKQKANE